MISYELGVDVGYAMHLAATMVPMLAMMAMHLAMMAMHCWRCTWRRWRWRCINLCCAELFGDVGDWRFDSIHSIRLDGKCRCLNRIESISFQVRTFLFPLQPEGVAVVAVEKRKKKSGGGG